MLGVIRRNYYKKRQKLRLHLFISLIVSLFVSCGENPPKQEHFVTGSPIQFIKQIPSTKFSSMAKIDFIKSELKSQISNSVGLKLQSHFPHENRPESFSIEYAYREVPFCWSRSKAHFLENGELFVMGRKPNLIPTRFDEQPLDSIFDNPEEVEKFVRAEFAAESFWLPQKPNQPVVTGKHRCFLNEKNSKEAVPAYKFMFGPFLIIADQNKIFLRDDQTLGVTGKTRVLSRVKNGQSNLVEVTIPGIVPSGFLETDFISTVVYGEDKLYSEDYVFTPQIGSSGFAEVSLFTNSVKQYFFMENLGFSFEGYKPVVIHVHRVPVDAFGTADHNNGKYLPNGPDINFQKPSILVGAGDGSTAKNMKYEPDVIAHEFTHHVVFQYLQTTQGEAVMLHEGLADYFTIARSGDPCLAPSICTAPGAGLCAFANQCLRTADNSLKFNDATYQSYDSAAHLKSQLISGLLWNVRQNPQINKNAFDKVVYRSVTLLNENSGLEEYLLAILVSAKEKKQNNISQVLRQELQSRGLGQYLAKIDRNDQVNTKLQDIERTEASIPDVKPKQNNSSGGGCTVGTESDFSLLMLLGSMTLFLRFRCFRRSRFD